MVKCSECGFLALRNIETGDLDEAEEEFRTHGWRREYSRSHPAQITGTSFHREEELTRYVHEVLPICFARRCDFWAVCTEAAQAATSESTRSENIRLVINTERKCRSFVKWQQGFIPKEHREMIDWERERRLRIFELIVFVFITLIAGIGGAIVGALIARGVI